MNNYSNLPEELFSKGNNNIKFNNNNSKLFEYRKSDLGTKFEKQIDSRYKTIISQIENNFKNSKNTIKQYVIQNMIISFKEKVRKCKEAIPILKHTSEYIGFESLVIPGLAKQSQYQFENPDPEYFIENGMKKNEFNDLLELVFKLVFPKESNNSGNFKEYINNVIGDWNINSTKPEVIAFWQYWGMLAIQLLQKKVDLSQYKDELAVKKLWKQDMCQVLINKDIKSETGPVDVKINWGEGDKNKALRENIAEGLSGGGGGKGGPNSGRRGGPKDRGGKGGPKDKRGQDRDKRKGKDKQNRDKSDFNKKGKEYLIFRILSENDAKINESKGIWGLLCNDMKSKFDLSKIKIYAKNKGKNEDITEWFIDGGKLKHEKLNELVDDIHTNYKDDKETKNILGLNDLTKKDKIESSLKKLNFTIEDELINNKFKNATECYGNKDPFKILKDYEKYYNILQLKYKSDDINSFYKNTYKDIFEGLVEYYRAAIKVINYYIVNICSKYSINSNKLLCAIEKEGNKKDNSKNKSENNSENNKKRGKKGKRGKKDKENIEEKINSPENIRKAKLKQLEELVNKIYTKAVESGDQNKINSLEAITQRIRRSLFNNSEK